MSPGFLEHETLLHQIASTDVVDSEWSRLREIIKFKIEKNITLFLSEGNQGQPPPRPFSPINFPSGGLKLPPFPPRKPSQLNAIEIPVNYMNEDQANEMKHYIFAQLHSFDSPPFTIQRLCELCVSPKLHYSCLGKYLRAVEKSILVTSTWDAFPPLPEKGAETSMRSVISGSSLSSAPATPLFSPIPFLHEDARRSKSRSPPPSPLALSSANQVSGGHPEIVETKALGLVDELDDPSPSHMSDHPTPLTAVTTIAQTQLFLPSLEERFTKAENNEEGSTQKADVEMVVDKLEEGKKA